MWHGKSVISGPQDRLALVRWDRSKPLSYFNTVCLSKDEATVHENLPADADLQAHYSDGKCDILEDGDAYRNITPQMYSTM